MASGADPIDELLGGACAGDALPGAVAIVVDTDGVVYEGAAGRLSVDGDAPVRVDTMFRNASMTKALATTGALQLSSRAGSGSSDASIDAAGVRPSCRCSTASTATRRACGRRRSRRRFASCSTTPSGCGYFFTNEKLVRYARLTGAPTVLTACSAA